MSVSDKLKALGVKSADEMKHGPVWDGPESDKPNGGITYSLLSRWLVCRERFRCLVIDGLRVADSFNHRLEYGNMWHLCEEYQNEDWQRKLIQYCAKLIDKYRFNQEEIDKWYEVCKLQFPIYKKFWSEREKKDNVIVISTEDVFCSPYVLPSERIVYLRGKRDELQLREGGVYLKENKTKGDVEELKLGAQLKFDLQTMMYLVSLEHDRDEIGNELDNLGMWYDGWDFGGVIYNVVRRPLSGGKGTIVQKKGSKNIPPESKEAYYKRLQSIIDGSGEDAPGPEHFFMRWKIDITQGDIKRFKERFLNPALEQLCCWYDGAKGSQYLRNIPYECLNYMMPNGVFNPLLEGRGTDYDNYLATGDSTGLVRNTELFPELADNA